MQYCVTNIKEEHVEHTGGNLWANVLTLTNDKVVVITEDAIGLYKDIESWESGEDSIGIIYTYDKQ